MINYLINFIIKDSEDENSGSESDDPISDAPYPSQRELSRNASNIKISNF